MADVITAAVAAAMRAEKRIADSPGTALAAVPKKRSSAGAPSAKEAPALPATKANANAAAEKKSEAGTEGTADSAAAATPVESPRKKRRARPAAKKAGSNWKKLKVSLDAEAAANPRRPYWKKRAAVEKRPRGGDSAEAVKDAVKTDAAPSAAAAAAAAADGKMHSAFARRAVAVQGGTLTRVVALDCEMVEVRGSVDALARASVVNVRGDVVLDTFVVVRAPVTDFRTAHSGVTAEDIVPGAPRARELADVRAAVGDALRGRILVGHALRNDLRVLGMTHPAQLTRDTSHYFRRRGGRPQKLAMLVAAKLGVDEFQKGSHDSAEDARAALALYKKFGKEWEKAIRERSEATREGKRTARPRVRPNSAR